MNLSKVLYHFLFRIITSFQLNSSVYYVFKIFLYIFLISIVCLFDFIYNRLITVIELIILILLYFQILYKYFILLKYISLHIFQNLLIIFVVNIQYEDIFDIYLKFFFLILHIRNWLFVFLYSRSF